VLIWFDFDPSLVFKPAEKARHTRRERITNLFIVVVLLFEILEITIISKI
jgi:hypothetical protein